VPRREPEALLKQARAAIDDMVSRDAQAITVHPSVTSREVFFCATAECHLRAGMMANLISAGA
jgi:hypothetical protein